MSHRRRRRWIGHPNLPGHHMAALLLAALLARHLARLAYLLRCALLGRYHYRVAGRLCCALLLCVGYLLANWHGIAASADTMRLRRALLRGGCDVLALLHVGALVLRRLHCAADLLSRAGLLSVLHRVANLLRRAHLLLLIDVARYRWPWRQHHQGEREHHSPIRHLGPPAVALPHNLDWQHST
jgi:hypothetical protein